MSPSTYTAFSQCRLKGVLLLNKTEDLLLKSPRAYLGSIIHVLLEEGLKRTIENFEQFEERWEELIERTESELSHSPLTRHLVPFSITIPELLQKKFKCWETIRDIMHSPGGSTLTRPHHLIADSNLTELWVQTCDGLIGGFIDSIQIRPEGAVLFEFKSGEIFTHDTVSNISRDIREDYLNQLSLYAGLFFESYGTWPSEIRLVSIANGTIPVPVSPISSQLLINEIKTDISQTNCLIRRESNKLALICSLASPSSDSCRFCSYRPMCKPYWDAREKNPDQLWPRDVQGNVLNVALLGNNTQLVTIRQTQAEGDLITIRGLTPSRYDLSETVGKHLAFYNLNSDIGLNNYKEGQLTTIYILNQNYSNE